MISGVFLEARIALNFLGKLQPSISGIIMSSKTKLERFPAWQPLGKTCSRPPGHRRCTSLPFSRIERTSFRMKRFVALSSTTKNVTPLQRRRKFDRACRVSDSRSKSTSN